MRRYVCLIIDIEKSKKYSIDNRNQIQFYMDKYIRSCCIITPTKKEANINEKNTISQSFKISKAQITSAVWT